MRVPRSIAVVMGVALLAGCGSTTGKAPANTGAATTAASQAGAPSPAVSPSPSFDPAQSPRGKFRANAAVTLTCESGKPKVTKFLLVDAPKGSSPDQAVKTTEPVALDGTCVVLFSPIGKTNYVRFNRPWPAAYKFGHHDWGFSGTADHSYDYDQHTLVADKDGTAIMILLDSPELPPGRPLVHHDSCPAYPNGEGCFTAPAGISDPPPPPKS
jgi:hypothetical protein